MSLVVVGSVAIDSIKTPHGEVHDALGGSAVHFVLASRFFAPTRLVGVVGGDFPDKYRQLLSDRGVDLAGLETVANGESFRWSGEYFDDMNQRETLSVDLNVFESFQPKLPEDYRDASFVFLANGAPSTQASVLDQMSGKPFVMADTMDLWIRIAHGDLEELLRRIDGLVLNDQEAFLLSDCRNLVQAGRKIVDRYDLAILVIKKGEHGCLIFRGGEEINLPALPLGDVVDPTGAGDSFAGGLMGHLARENRTDVETFKRAVAWGTVQASFCCEGFGVDRVARLEWAESEKRYRRYQSMLQIG
ncbi:MAG: sugar kinase [Planctomycetes bacterium]|nr:sugar kinase [Planctomycetota bacterium]